MATDGRTMIQEAMTGRIYHQYSKWKKVFDMSHGVRNAGFSGTCDSWLVFVVVFPHLVSSPRELALTYLPAVFSSLKVRCDEELAMKE